MTDMDIEKEIVAKGKTAARVTPERIEAVISGEFYFTGYTVTGESACASPENFDPEIGRKIARQNAIAKIWPLEGYLLKQQLHEVK